MANPRAVLRGLARARRFIGRRIAGAEPHFRLMADQAADGILIIDAQGGEVIYTNRALRERAGCAEGAELRLADLFDAATGGELPQYAQWAESRAPISLQQRKAGGRVLEVEVRCTALTVGGRDAYALMTRDVSVRNKVEQQLIENQQRLDQMAHHDQLTGLPNRHYLQAFLPQIIDTARRSQTLFGVVFMDLDRFKHINDTRGHEVGDKLLQEVARRIRAAVRDTDVVIRMGGDEFVVILCDARSCEEISQGAGRLVNALNKPLEIEGHLLQTSASIGVSVFPRDGSNMTELLKHSDTAMYQAKDRGRNNVQVFSVMMNRKLEQRVAVEAALRDAIRLKQLDVYYQPLVNLRTRKVVALEALIRWHHPSKGLIPPDQFIPVAEETGLVVPLGKFVAHRTLQNMVNWRKLGLTLVPVSMNVSPAQLQEGDLKSTLLTLLSSYGLDPKLLQLEMTERTVFDLSVPLAGESRRNSIAQLRDLGIHIAIDDFGTGYSSLSYLKHCQVDSLKIDKSFVRDLATDSNDLAIVSAIIAIARHLQIQVVAEGIEAYQQADILQKLGCQLGQGFLFSHPVPAAQCPELLARVERIAAADPETDMLAELPMMLRETQLASA